MQEWRTIKAEIEDALSDFDCDVYYQRPLGHGWNAQCSYFTVTINEDDYDMDYVESLLEDVCDEWDLGLDGDSEGDIDLNAYWDIHN